MTVSAQETLTFPASRASAGLAWLCRVWRELAANPLTLAGIMVIVGLLVMAVAAPGMTSYDPLAQDLLVRIHQHRLGGGGTQVDTDKSFHDRIS